MTTPSKHFPSKPATTIALAGLMLILLVGLPNDAQAKRGSSSSSSTSSSARDSAPATSTSRASHHEEDASSSTPARVNIALPGSAARSAAAPAAPTTAAVGAASAARAGTGTDAEDDDQPARAPTPQPSAEDRQRTAKLEQLADELVQSDAAKQKEAARRAAELVLIEKRKTDELNARRQAQLDAANERERLRIARERQCAIKPVMSDAEIDLCKTVLR
jgi:signal transduction histidine kinase